jgi:hypothetical protein
MDTLSGLWQKAWLTQRPDAVTSLHFSSSVRVQRPIEIKCYIYLFVCLLIWFDSLKRLVRDLNAYRRIILKWNEENKSMEQSHSWEFTSRLAAENVSAFCGSRRFVIAFARACHCLEWVDYCPHQSHAVLVPFPYFENIKVGLCDHRAVCDCVSACLCIPPRPVNFRMPEPIYINLYMYIMAPEPISARTS